VQDAQSDPLEELPNRALAEEVKVLAFLQHGQHRVFGPHKLLVGPRIGIAGRLYDDKATRAEEPGALPHERQRIDHVLEHIIGHDDVKAMLG
jgi:hypothetical protein